MRALDLEAKCPRMKPSALLSACLLAMAFALAGCVLNVGPSSPRPNVMIRASDAPTELTLAPNIQESYVIPRSASIVFRSLAPSNGTSALSDTLEMPSSWT